MIKLTCINPKLYRYRALCWSHAKLGAIPCVYEARLVPAGWHIAMNGATISIRATIDEARDVIAADVALRKRFETIEAFAEMLDRDHQRLKKENETMSPLHTTHALPESRRSLERERLASEDLVRLLKDSGLTARQLSELLGVSMQAVYSWRQGVRTPCCSHHDDFIIETLEGLES